MHVLYAIYKLASSDLCFDKCLKLSVVKHAPIRGASLVPHGVISASCLMWTFLSIYTVLSQCILLQGSYCVMKSKEVPSAAACNDPVDQKREPNPFKNCNNHVRWIFTSLLCSFFMVFPVYTTMLCISNKLFICVN